MARTRVRRFLDTTGDGTGTKNAGVNGSSTPVIHRIRPAAGETIYLSDLFVSFTAAAQLVADGYGDLAALTNGIKVEVVSVNSAGDVTVEEDLLDGLTIKSHDHWGRYLGENSGGHPLIIRGVSDVPDGYRELRVTIQDDLSTMDEHYFLARGYSEA